MRKFEKRFARMRHKKPRNDKIMIFIRKKKSRACEKIKLRKNIETGTGAIKYIPKIRKACKWGMTALELPTINNNKPEQSFNKATAPMTQEGHKNRRK